MFVTYRLFSFAMALFWVFVQQTCLCCAKWACYDLRGTLLENVWPAGADEERPRDLRRFVLQQIALLAALIGSRLRISGSCRRSIRTRTTRLRWSGNSCARSC